MAEQSLFVDLRTAGSVDALRLLDRFEVQTIRGESEVFALESTWRALYRENYQDSPFCRFEWFEAWWKHFGSRLTQGATSADLRAILIKRLGKVVGLACFYTHGYPKVSLNVRSLRPVGVLGYRHSDLTEEPILLIEKGYEEEVLPLLQDRLLSLKSEFDLVQLHYIASSETRAEIPCRRQMFLKRGYWHESTQMLSLDLPKSWEAFVAGQSAKSQEHIKRKPRALTKRCGEWKVEFASPEETEWAADELVRLHRIRNDASKGRTIHIVSREHRLFYREYFRQMRERELGGIFVLKADGKVIAAQSVLFGEHDWLLFHQGHEPEWSQVSPLVILQMEAFKRAIESGVSKIRLHRFAQEWKLRWGAHPDGFFDQWISLRRNPASFLRTALYSVGRGCVDLPEDPVSS